MKITILLMGLLSLSALADSNADLLHQRMIERAPQTYSQSSFTSITDIPDEISDHQRTSLSELIDFASELDLFDLGFNYQLHEDIYEVNSNGSVLGYTYSIVVTKKNKLVARRFYILSRRVDGVYYTSRIATINF